MEYGINAVRTLWNTRTYGMRKCMYGIRNVECVDLLAGEHGSDLEHGHMWNTGCIEYGTCPIRDAWNAEI